MHGRCTSPSHGGGYKAQAAIRQIKGTYRTSTLLTMEDMNERAELARSGSVIIMIDVIGYTAINRSAKWARRNDMILDFPHRQGIDWIGNYHGVVPRDREWTLARRARSY